MGIIAEPHKATIKRHLEESLALGVPLDQIHRELVEVFQVKGKYTLPQITAVTSWLRSSILHSKRVQEITWDEGEDDINEDTGFDNPEKNAARDWQVQQLLRHTTLENRKEMSYLLLPGKNNYDFEAFAAIGLQGKNLLTYILGKHPKAVAQYVRNCREHGVENRRIGEMNRLFPQEPIRIRGAYLDYFGQLCLDSSIDSHLLPLDCSYCSN